MSLMCPIGPESNLLEPSAKQCHRLFLPNPILSLKDLLVIKNTTHRGWKVCSHTFSKSDLVCGLWCFDAKISYGFMCWTFQSKVIDITFPREDGAQGLQKALIRVADESCKAARDGYQILILSDRKAGETR